MAELKSAASKLNRAKASTELQLYRWQYDALKQLSAETRVPMSVIVRELLRGPLIEMCLEKIGQHAEKVIGWGDA